MFSKLSHPRVRVIAGVVVVGVLAAAAYVGARATANKSPAAAATTRTVAATVGTMTETVSASGTLAPAATEDLSFSASGTVTAVNVKAGQKVAKGQVLATIDSATLASAVVQAQAQVAADESTLESDTSADASSAQLTADRANLASDQSQLTSAQTALAGASLVSPISGVVSSVDLTVGEQLGTNGSGGTDPAASSADGSSSTAQVEVVSTSLVVNLSVDDTEIAKLKAGQSATVSPSSSSGSSNSSIGGFGGFGGFGAPGAANANSSTANSSTSNTSNATSAGNVGSTSSAATVTSVGTIASASSGVATFPVVVKITGATTGLYSGATAQATITYKQLDNVIQVPTLAVTQSNGQSYVTVSANGKTTKRAVATGITSNGEVQIASGLKAGEQVVVTLPSATRNNANASNSKSSSNGGGGQFPGGGGTFIAPGSGTFKAPGQ